MPLPSDSKGRYHELWASYKEKGRIGNTKPRNAAHARRIISAIALKRKGKPKRQKRHP